MATQATVGKSGNKRSFDAGREAALTAKERLGETKPDLALVFATTGYDQTALLAGVRDITGETPLGGCSTEGVITQEGSDETAHAVAVMLLASDRMRFHTFLLEGVSQDSPGCGARLAEAVNAADSGDGKLLLVLPDGMTANASALIDALEGHLAHPLKVAGGGAGEMMRFEKTYQYGNDRVVSDGVAAVLISGNLDVEVAVSHGSEPIGVEHTVTAAEGPFVVEIDDEPAWDLFKEYCDGDPEDLQSTEVAYLSLSQRLPREVASEYGEWIIRTPLGLNKENGALFFPGGIATGTNVQLTRRDADKIHQSIVETVNRVQAHHPDRKPAVVFQFDCCGRGGLFFGDKATAMVVNPIQEGLGKDIPWIGQFSYGEIAPIGPKTYYHNFTVVLCALYE